MDDEDVWFSGWAETYLTPEAVNAWEIRWEHSGAAVMGGVGWRAIYEASRRIADGTSEGALTQALVEVGAIPYRGRYQSRHA